MSLFDLTGKVALVTGGNGGIGLGYARGMARQGAKLVIWGRDPEKNRAAEDMLREAGSPQVMSTIVDVGSEAAVLEGFAQAIQRVGQIDCVVSNAGHATKQPSLMETSSDAWHSLLNVHLNGGFYLVREAARHMTERSVTAARGGSILICGSLAVFAGGEGIEHYGAAKAGLAGLMKGAAAELGKFGIRVNMVCPGYVATEMSGGAKVDQSFLIAKTPLGRVGSPSDFEGIAAYLASDAASYHTGDIITIDGGWMSSLF